MPRPLYIICSESGSIDQFSNSISFFNVVELVRVSRFAPGQTFVLPPTLLLRMRLVAAWLCENEDRNHNFEAQFFGQPQNQPEAALGAASPFTFTDPVQRLIVTNFSLPPLVMPGPFRIECRIRQVGQEAWLSSQHCFILIEEVPIEEAFAQAPNALPPQAAPPIGNDPQEMAT